METSFDSDPRLALFHKSHIVSISLEFTPVSQHEWLKIQSPGEIIVKNPRTLKKAMPNLFESLELCKVRAREGLH